MDFRDAEPDRPHTIPGNLPNPELSPATNPVLDRHLGRWAQVYFTSPPEKREHAVGELLRELQNHPIENHVGASNPVKLREPESKSEMWCPQCRLPNATGRESCKFCGSLLGTDGGAVDSAFETAPNPEFRSVALQHESISSVELNSPPELEGRRGLSQATAAELNAGAYRRLKFALAGCSILTAAILYLVFGLHSRGRRSENRTSEARVSDSSSPTSLIGTQPTEVTPKQDDKVGGAVGRTASSESSPAFTPSTAGSEIISSAAARMETTDGTEELRVAQQYLAGDRRPRDPAEAVKWLWKAVSKQNAAATLRLADLYLKGDGVPRNCEQARLLLTAAAQHHASSASERLQNLDSAGCP